MKLKYNTAAFTDLLTYATEGGEVSVAGVPAKYFCGLNGGFYIGTNGTAVGFVKSLIGTGWGWITSVRGLWIYKGVPPTLGELETYIAAAPVKVTATDIFRYSDLLIKYTPLTQSVTNTSLIHSFSPSTATASGQASWFIIGVYADNSSGVALPSYLIMGTITESAGGGDIELADLNIVSGTQYRLPPYELKFPSKLSS